MTSDERQLFLADRQQGIGGSDAASLLSNRFDVEYGCERALWARLSDIPEDNPADESEPMILGTLLEPYVANAYSDITGRELEIVGLKKHPTEPSLQVHADRIIHPRSNDARTTNGVLEIKAVGREMMRKVQEDGLCEDYICQLNHGMLVHGLTWGAFAVAMRDDLLPLVAIELAAKVAGQPLPIPHRRAKILHFEMERSPEICRAIEEYGPKFWKTLGDYDAAPPRLEPEDPRCGRCPRKIWCQGTALMEGVEPESHIPRRMDLVPLVDEYRKNVALLEVCQEMVQGTEDKFKAALGNTTAAQVPLQTEKGPEWKNIIYRLRSGSERVDGKSMALTYDNLRRKAIEHHIPGAELVPLSSEFTKVGMPSRPLLLSAVLPKKPKGKGEVPEVDKD